jgi:hypothetical protein
MKPKPTEFYSVNALSKMTGRDRRTLDKVLVNVKPAGKRAGKPVYRLDEVNAAMRAVPNKTLREEKLAEEIRKLKQYNDREAGLLIEDEATAKWLYGIAKRCSQVLWQKLVNEMPAAVAGMDEAAARGYAKKVYNAVQTGLREIVADAEMRKTLAGNQQ